MRTIARKIKSIELSVPSRIHFGLLPPGADPSLRRGGLGVMVDQPRYILRATPASQFRVIGDLGDRIGQYVRLYFRAQGLEDMAWQIELLDAPPAHTGLGSGTQLALSTATLLDGMRGNETFSETNGSTSFGRGLRSLVGSVGYHKGGLIWDPGYGIYNGPDETPQHTHAEIACCQLPREWCWLLVRQRTESGLSGDGEVAAFESIPSATKQRQSLIRIVEQRLLPAAKRAAFSAFGTALYEYGIGCARLFIPFQEGPYSTEGMRQIVHRIRRAGVQGVGQSSWGPTLYVLFQSKNTALGFVDRERWLRDRGLELTLAATARGGAQKTVRYFEV